MQMKKISLLCALTFLSTYSYAMLCPNNFNTINPGDTLEMVQQKCGKPISQTTSQSQPNVPQEWNYYLKLQPTDTATVKTGIAFVGGKVVNISVNNVGITSTGICGTTISVGDDENVVKKACGKPAFISQNNGPLDQVQKMDPSAKDTDMVYTDGMKQVTLHFKDGKLATGSSQ